MPTHFQGDPQTTLALDLFIKFTRAGNSLESSLSRSTALEGLTASQFGVLETLWHLGPLCLGELGKKMLKSGADMTQVVDNLEKQGLVERRRKENDRRSYQIHLTPLGQEMIGRVFPRYASEIARAFSALNEDEQRTLAQLCRTLGTSLSIS